MPHTLNCRCVSLSYLNFKAVLALPKSARSAQTHKSISFICIVWSTLYVYLCLLPPTFFGLCCLAKDFCTSNLRKWYCQLTSETYCKLQKILCASLPLCLLEVEHRLGKVWGLSVTSPSAKFFFFSQKLNWIEKDAWVVRQL